MKKYIIKNDAVKFLSEVMGSAGLSFGEAKRWAELLTETSLLGFDTHGIRMAENYVELFSRGGAKAAVPKLLVDKGAIALFDGLDSLGHLAAWAAVVKAADNAKKYGISFTAVKNAGHIGACSIYTKALAQRDCIGIACATSRPGIAPTGGTKATVGINPLSVAAPIGGNDFFLLDMSTTVTAMGKVTMAQDSGQSLPLGWALNKDGKPTTDPREAKAGSLLPIGGYKGYGLALSIELICSALIGGSFAAEISSWLGDPSTPPKIPFSMIALDISHFNDPGVFKAIVKEWLAKVVDVPKQEGVNRIYVPGEMAAEHYRIRSNEGIPIEEITIESYKRLAKKYSVLMAHIIEK
ncbi:MAG: Ldh family oxidoreductase [Treponema sp.]|jgi:LDH2 family malate/lactate/ureidoglycolate dehydrogenase|nr:Ldh family oxidoreductase [Treponema sp.]